VVRLARGVEDQLTRTGHDGRIHDLDRFAALGLRTLRYPILWERHAGQSIDWSWADARLGKLRELGIRPIVGLLHHGCGPLADGFLAPDFLPAFTHFARAVAARYPWVDAYTPINEPLTTARFSGLYGLWHPFGRDAATFSRIFVLQCEATREVMRAIRQVNPEAQLVQTEDIGKTHSTPRLSAQAAWENERRWLTYDILTGTLAPRGALFGYLVENGVAAARLNSFRDDPCPPDLLGMNHYVTSERFLDERIEKYPGVIPGGNGRDRYVDVPAVRVRAEGVCGPTRLMHELWQRYHRPIAVTEAHLNCTRDEQLRWLDEFWEGAKRLRHEGVDVRAVTSWALLGAYDWDSLLLEAAGHYEVGAFDVRGAQVQPTAVATAIADLAECGEIRHPAVRGSGWWRRPIRFAFPPVSAAWTGPGTAIGQETFEPRLLVVGSDVAARTLLAAACHVRGLLAVFVRDHAEARQWASQFTPWEMIEFTGGDFTRTSLHRMWGAVRAGRASVLRTLSDERVHALLDALIDRR